MHGQRHLSLVGTTGSGKSALALALVDAFPGVFEIVSVDSMQVYRGMDIGTAKPSAEEQVRVAHHGIDLVEPGEDFTVTEFQSAAWSAVRAIESRGRRALLVGGTGLYLQAVIDQLDIPPSYPELRTQLEAEPLAALWAELQRIDPVAAERIEPDNRRRIVRALEVVRGCGRPFSSFGPGLDAHPVTPFRQVGLWLPRESGNQRIRTRVSVMADAGWKDEVARLREASWSRTARQALGYPEWEAVLDGTLPEEEALQRIGDKTVAFARRQRMWFRRDPRITWFGTATDPERVVPAVLRDCERWLSNPAPLGDD